MSVAIQAYQEAAKLSPDNALPQSNLSAAYYETGKYAQCIAAATAALKLLGGDSTPLHVKLRCRLCYAYLHLQDPDSAAEMLKTVNKHAAEYTMLSRSIEQMRAAQGTTQAPAELRSKILAEIPSCKPALFV
jgi:tetratricopeptide (TPR) repeat protein